MTRTEKIFGGIAILAKYPDADIAVGHDLIFCGPAVDKVTDEDRKLLEDMGWFIEEDSWARFV